mmetsp:Transcript_27425/g.94340  ORF Transcript_27425/g.94340 Transcript_27425/m.94340 type:complete len:256 (-) Transcript_27425:237-1004(-)
MMLVCTRLLASSCSSPPSARSAWPGRPPTPPCAKNAAAASGIWLMATAMVMRILDQISSFWKSGRISSDRSTTSGAIFFHARGMGFLTTCAQNAAHKAAHDVHSTMLVDGALQRIIVAKSETTMPSGAAAVSAPSSSVSTWPLTWMISTISLAVLKMSTVARMRARKGMELRARCTPPSPTIAWKSLRIRPNAGACVGLRNSALMRQWTSHQRCGRSSCSASSKSRSLRGASYDGGGRMTSCVSSAAGGARCARM